MTLSGEYKELKALISLDQGIRHTDCVAGVDIVVDVSGDKHEMTFETGSKLRVCVNLIYESCVSFLCHSLLHSMVGLTPPTVIDAVVVVSGTRDSSLEEIRILKDCRRRHETTARMSVDAHTIHIYIFMFGSELLNSRFLIGETIVAQIAIAIVMIPL